MDIHVGEASWRNDSFSDDNKGKLFVFFHTEQVKSNFETAKQKRPVFVPRVFITKMVPGDNRLKIDRPMRESDKEEFPVEWARFEQKKANVIEGTPLDAWPILNDTQKAEFKALNIFTVEQFANLPDSAAEKIMGMLDLRAKARAFVMIAKDDKILDKIAAQDKEMAELRAQLLAMQSKPERKKPGRKPKVLEEIAA